MTNTPALELTRREMANSREQFEAKHGRGVALGKTTRRFSPQNAAALKLGPFLGNPLAKVLIVPSPQCGAFRLYRSYRLAWPSRLCRLTRLLATPVGPGWRARLWLALWCT
jgi:hypothetical protein